ncbi:MAG: hypothetical protein SH857_03310 [Chitinophagales bacterium]|nr:hypothetical protein [Chitinophagales bacterium]
METLTSPKITYLLEAGLDVLHVESKEWLSELKFLKSELDFFMKLLNSKAFELDKEPQRQHIYENMNKLCTAIVTELEREVTTHEKNLAELLTSKSGSDASYRAQHKQLKAKTSQIDNDVRTLKMLVFRLVEHIK